MLDLVNIDVVHKAFGNGVVTFFDGQHVKVRFSNVEKIFGYPQAFNGFLSVSGNPEVKKQIQQDVQGMMKSQAALEEQRRQENLRAMENGAVHGTSQKQQEYMRHKDEGEEPEEQS